MRATPLLRMRPTQALRIRQSPILRMAVPKEEQSGHTVSQRIRRLKDIPTELIPLGVVIGAALVAAGYAMFNKITTDKTLRLSRKGPGH